MPTWTAVNPWPYWTTGTASTSAVITGSSVWPAWVDATTGGTAVPNAWQCWVTNTTTTTSGVWPAWTAGQVQVRGNNFYVPPAPAYTPPSERDKRIMATRRRASELRARVAARTAERLLLDHLDDTQRDEWREGRSFHIETAGGRRRYRIRRGLAGNVELVRDGDREAEGRGYLRRYCMHVYHPDGRVPDEDNVLAQKLILEADEAEFLRLANAF